MDNLVRDNIAMEIAGKLSDNELPDINNFSSDTAAIPEYVRNIILKRLKDYSYYPAQYSKYTRHKQ